MLLSPPPPMQPGTGVLASFSESGISAAEANTLPIGHAPAPAPAGAAPCLPGAFGFIVPAWTAHFFKVPTTTGSRPGDELTFTAATDGGPNQRAGSLARSRRALGNGNLTEARLERAIAEVEDLIMPLLRALPVLPALELQGPEWTEVVALLAAGGGGNAGAGWPIAAEEQLFNQLADHAGGSPVAWRHAASPARVALVLLVLREVMHHGGFHSAFWLPQTA